MIRIFTETFANLIDSTAAILKAERESGRYRSLSEDTGSVYVPVNGVVERSNDANAMPASLDKSMDAEQQWKQGDVDVVLPSLFIALLFIGNAIIVYVIFQYRKRKQPAIGREQGEEMALRSPTTEDLHQV